MFDVAFVLDHRMNVGLHHFLGGVEHLDVHELLLEEIVVPAHARHHFDDPAPDGLEVELELEEGLLEPILGDLVGLFVANTCLQRRLAFIRQQVVMILCCCHGLNMVLIGSLFGGGVDNYFWLCFALLGADIEECRLLIWVELFDMLFGFVLLQYLGNFLFLVAFEALEFVRDAGILGDILVVLQPLVQYVVDLHREQLVSLLLRLHPLLQVQLILQELEYFLIEALAFLGLHLLHRVDAMLQLIDLVP